MAALHTDSFTTGSPDKVLATYDSDYVESDGGHTVYEALDNCRPTTGGVPNTACWTGATFNDDQYSQIVLDATGDLDRFHGCGVRISSADGHGYYYQLHETSGARIVRLNGTTWTVIGSDADEDSTVPDTVYLQAVGTTVSAKLNGSASAIGDQTDSTHTAGDGGFGSDSWAFSRYDDFDTGNTAVATGNPWHTYAQQ